MKSSSKPYPIKPHYKWLVKLIIALFKKLFAITASVPDEVAALRTPYLLLSNHYGRYDPFIISDFLTKKPNFVSSDAILRHPFYGPLFSGLGAIPKKKGVRDTQVIREMKKVIDAGGAVALFPEGTRTWSGVTHPIDPSIAKLAKLLNVAVVLVNMKGAYAFDPRWAKPLRRAKVELDYSLVPQHKVNASTSKELMQVINNHLQHDDINWAQSHSIKIKSSRRAEYIERVLFQCPKCESYHGFIAVKNHFWCNACGYKVFINRFGRFEHAGKPAWFTNPRDWFNWQAKNFTSYVRKLVQKENQQPIWQSEQMNIHENNTEYKMVELGLATTSFYTDKIVLAGKDFLIELPHNEISSLSPQFKERVELFYQDKAYRISSTRHHEPGVKWELAINAVWFANNQHFKLSPYFKYLFEG